MQTVSDAWIENQKQTLTSEGFVEISFIIGDNVAQTHNVCSDNGAMYFSQTHRITEDGGEENLKNWASLELNDWILDGSAREFVPEQQPLYPYNTHGFVGNGVSLDTELFSTNPVIALEFDFTGASQSEISGISILWDEIGGEAARDFQVKAYNGDTLLQTVTVTDNTDFWSFVEISLLEYSKITIEVQEWCLPQYHAKLSGVVMGRRVKFDKTNLINYEHSMSVDKCSLVLPENKISFTVDNSNGWFNPQNPEGIGKYVSEMQRFTVKYGFKIGNGVEWIPGGVFYLNDWSAPQNGITATFAGGDAFSLGVMGEKYTGALNNSLYNIAIAAISQANDILNEQVVIEADVSTELQGYNVNIPADEYECTIGETLQLIANALYRPLFQKRDGRLSIGFSVSGNNAVWSNQSITQNVAYQFGEYEVLKQIKRAIINDSGEYQVTGSTTGEVVNFDNIFVKYFTVSGLSVFYAAGLVNYLNGQKSVSGEYRPDPSTDCLDLSIIENKYSTANAMISELSFTYNGAFRGRYKGVIYSES